jgi:hypothetical protein
MWPIPPLVVDSDRRTFYWGSTASADTRQGHGPSHGRDGEHDHRGKPKKGPGCGANEESSELRHNPWPKVLTPLRTTRMGTVERVHGIEREGGRVEVEGNQEPSAGADGRDCGGFWRGPRRGRAEVTVGSDRRRGIVVEAEPEDTKRVCQGQVVVLLNFEARFSGRFSCSLFHIPLELCHTVTFRCI